MAQRGVGRKPSRIRPRVAAIIVAVAAIVVAYVSYSRVATNPTRKWENMDFRVRQAVEAQARGRMAREGVPPEQINARIQSMWEPGELKIPEPGTYQLNQYGGIRYLSKEEQEKIKREGGWKPFAAQ